MSRPAEHAHHPSELSQVQRLANQFRVDAIQISTRAGAGHPTSVMSCADVVALLLSRHFNYDWNHPQRRGNDRLILSKGHSGTVWYSALRAAGAISEAELLTYRSLGSRLQGHPTPALPWVDIATGSLGQGLPAGVGMALAMRMTSEPNHVWVLCGDGEMAEGSMWEALDKAAIYGLHNLTPIIDVNGMGQSGRLPYPDPVRTLEDRVRAFGWDPVTVDGHDLVALDAAFTFARSAPRPVVLIAKTIKGKGADRIADDTGMHGVVFAGAAAASVIGELTDGEPPVLTSAGPIDVAPAVAGPPAALEAPPYALGQLVAIRDAFGDALLAAGANRRLVVVDGDMGPSTRTAGFAKAYGQRFVQSYIAEQQMVGTAVGLSARGLIPVISTYGSFLTRAADFIRMAAVSRSTLILCGSHCGVEIGTEGPSQMALEDIAFMCTVPASQVFYPSDAVAMWRLLELAVSRPGITYLRITRNPYPVLYSGTEVFTAGGLKTLRASTADQCLIVAAGLTLHEGLTAATELHAQSIPVRVVDLYSIKPLDVAGLIEALAACAGRLVIAEDHYPEGGIGATVLQALAGRAELKAVRHLAVREVPGSATREEQLQLAGIGSQGIIDAVKELTKETS